MATTARSILVSLLGTKGQRGDGTTRPIAQIMEKIKGPARVLAFRQAAPHGGTLIMDNFCTKCHFWL